MNAPELVSLLGDPTLKRRDPPAEVWQYSGRSCVLHVFMYWNEARASFRAVHIEMLKRSGARTKDPECLARIRDEAGISGRDS